MRNNRMSPSDTTAKYKEIITLLLLCIAGMYFLSLYSHSFTENPFSAAQTLNSSVNYLGIFGAYLADISYTFIGYSSYVLAALIIVIALRYYLGIFTTLNHWVVPLRFIGGVVLLLNTTGLLNLIDVHYGGVVGDELNALLSPYLAIGLWIIYIVLELALISLLTGLSWVQVVQTIGTILGRIWHSIIAILHFIRTIITRIAHMIGKITKRSNTSAPSTAASRSPTSARSTSTTVSAIATTSKTPKPRARTTNTVATLSTTSEDALPSAELLDTINTNPVRYSSSELQTMADNLTRELENFGISVSVVDIIPGPVITSFEVELPSGVKASKVVSLDKDLARALLVQSVRIVDVIPGKHTIGIEIPNAHRQMIQLREVIESQAYSESHAPLTMCLGKDTTGKEVVIDLAKTPHLLVAGATGMGKSVGLNAMLMGILFKSSPHDVRLIMIDPKVVELAIYADIPHLLTPVVTDMNQASSALFWSIGEMERRYALLAKHGVRNIAGFNEKVRIAKDAGTPLVNEGQLDEEGNPTPVEELPLIVIVIDEYADMLGALSGEDRAKAKRTEGFIIRIAQKARAAGMHLIIATQRPSVDVITGLIKSNIPSRIAFKVSSKIDSRTILDSTGAEGLLGLGDMLYMMPGQEHIQRVHGAFVSDGEIAHVVSFLKEKYPTNYIHDVVVAEDEPSETSNFALDNGGENDPLYDEAVEFVLSSGKVSISSVQRRLRVGYNRAARIIDDMEVAGLVSPMNANGSREILAPRN